MNKIFIKITIFLFLLINNAYSTTLVGSDGKPIEVNQKDTVPLSVIGEIPKGEQYMVDRALKQNPNLTRDDIHRIEFEAGTYYGQINSKGVPDGYGILGVGDTAMETNFKNGKVKRGADPTILSSTGEVVTGNDAVDFQNRAFNNGFDVSVVLGDVAKNLDMDFIIEEFYDLRYGVFRKSFKTLDYDFDLRDAMRNLQTNFDMLRRSDARGDEVNFETAMLQFYIDLDLEYRDLKELQLHRKLLTGFSVIELILLANFADDRAPGWLIRYELAKASDTLLTLDRLINIATFTSMYNLSYIDAIAALKQNYNLKPETDLPELTDIRIYSNVNLRRNTVGDAVIEGEFNGQFYEMEIDPKTLRLTLSKEGRKEFKKDQSGDNDREGGGGGHDGM